MDTITDIPEDILIDIFSRLPAKSVGKCRCLSKQWRALLSTPQFIKSHVARINQQNESLVLVSPSGSVHTVETITNNALSRNLERPDSWTGIDGSCDGLVLLTNDQSEKLLLNPVTWGRLRIPDPPLDLDLDPDPRRQWSCSLGLGCDSNRDDYKVVMLAGYYTYNEYDEPDIESIFVYVYSVKTAVWKRLENSSYDNTIQEIHSGAFVNGAIHWLANSRKSVHPTMIVALDLGQEVFYEIPPPKGVNFKNFYFVWPFVLRGRLCMGAMENCYRTDVWIMEEYGCADSWAKFSINDGYGWYLERILCFVGNERIKLALVTELKDLIVYDWEDGIVEDFVIDGVPRVLDGSSFVGSLVSPFGC